MSTWFRGPARTALLEPGDTRQQWKGEAAASFVCAGITSSRVLPTSSAGYWSPLLSCILTSASEATCSSGGDFFARKRLHEQLTGPAECPSACPGCVLAIGFAPAESRMRVQTFSLPRTTPDSEKAVHQFIGNFSLTISRRRYHCICSKISRRRAPLAGFTISTNPTLPSRCIRNAECSSRF